MYTLDFVSFRTVSMLAPSLIVLFKSVFTMPPIITGICDVLKQAQLQAGQKV